MSIPRSNLFWLLVAVLFVPVAVGLYAAFRIFTEGLGITNLTDLAPWGQWIAMDLSCIGLGAGAFSISAITYVLGLERFKPLARIAVFVGFLGYSGAMLFLLLDIGMPIRFWHGWVYWQVHSMLWEVTICLSLYFIVLTLEIFPMVVEIPQIKHVLGEKRHTQLVNIGHQVHKVTPILAIIGLILSMLHQSSLGGTYGVVAGRIALARATMPLLFIVSAVGSGIAFTVQVTLVVQWAKGRVLVPRKVLFDAGQIAGAIILVYIYMRFWDSTVGFYGYSPGLSEAQQTLTQGTRFAIPFWIWEIGFGGLVAGVLLVLAKRQQDVRMLMIGSGLAMAGLVANRWNTTMLAFSQPLTTSPPTTIPLVYEYTPNAIEWMISIGVVAGLSLLFTLGMRFIPAYRGVDPSEIQVSQEV